MIAFNVEIDGTHVVCTGVEDWSILALHVNAARKEANGRDYIDFNVGGLTLPDAEQVQHHFRWPNKPLAVGSVVTVKVVEIDHADEPAKRYRSDAKVQESPFTDKELRQMRYEDYLSLKAEFDPTGG